MHTHSSISFVREAFFHPVNLGFLLSVGIISLVFSGVQGLPVVLLTAGIGLELLYLGTIPNKGWFQRHIIRSQEVRTDRDSSETACFERLCMGRQKQFLALRRLTTTVRENFRLMPAKKKSKCAVHNWRRWKMLSGMFMKNQSPCHIRKKLAGIWTG